MTNSITCRTVSLAEIDLANIQQKQDKPLFVSVDGAIFLPIPNRSDSLQIKKS
jgi:hypothetical protein